LSSTSIDLHRLLFYGYITPRWQGLPVKMLARQDHAFTCATLDRIAFILTRSQPQMPTYKGLEPNWPLTLCFLAAPVRA
jgi:hypothetical protein